MQRLNFTCKVEDEGVCIRHKPSLLRRQLPTSEWASVRSTDQSTAIGQLKVASSSTEDGCGAILFEPDHLFLSHDAVAKLSRNVANQIGIPSDSPFALRLESNDHLMSKNFTLDSRWVRAGGIGTAVKVQGAFIIRAIPHTGYLHLFLGFTMRQYH